jgi:glycine betaine/proline transport system substrate-binding protein
MVSHVTVGVSTPFYDADPQLVSMLGKVKFPMDFLNSTILEMSTKKLDGSAMATQFLREHPEMWKQWVPADVASKVQAGLAGA